MLLKITLNLFFSSDSLNFFISSLIWLSDFFSCEKENPLSKIRTEIIFIKSLKYTELKLPDILSISIIVWVVIL